MRLHAYATKSHKSCKIFSQMHLIIISTDLVKIVRKEAKAEERLKQLDPEKKYVSSLLLLLLPFEVEYFLSKGRGCNFYIVMSALPASRE